MNSRLVTIGYSAFRECVSLTSVNIPSRVSTVKDSAFRDCSSLTSVKIGNSCTSIGDYAFSGDAALESISFGEHLNSIGYEAFYKCASLKTLSFNDNLLKIGSYAFQDCKGITSVRMGSHLTKISDGAFRGCDSLTKVTIHAKNVDISNYNVFNKGTQLTLRGYENSTVQKYAVSNNNRFEKITTSKLDAKAFSLKTTSYTWTGGYFYPQVACTNGLLQNVDYKVEYDYNSNAGTHTIEVYGINDYTGSVFLKYTVAKSGQTLTGSNTVKKTGATNSFRLDVKQIGRAHV